MPRRSSTSSSGDTNAERQSLGDDDGTTVGRCITVNSDQPLVRQRFTVAHGLGHLVMHSSHGTDSERQAEVFAGALFVPATQYCASAAFGK